MEKPNNSTDLFDYISERGVLKEADAKEIFKKVNIWLILWKTRRYFADTWGDPCLSWERGCSQGYQGWEYHDWLGYYGDQDHWLWVCSLPVLQHLCLLYAGVWWDQGVLPPWVDHAEGLPTPPRHCVVPGGAPVWHAAGGHPLPHWWGHLQGTISHAWQYFIFMQSKDSVLCNNILSCVLFVQDLITHCLRPCPYQRILLGDIPTHPWLTD